MACGTHSGAKVMNGGTAWLRKSDRGSLAWILTPYPMEAANPLQQKERIQILDAIRGLALCGILILNMPGFSGPYQWYFNFSIPGESGMLNKVVWYLQCFVFDGSFRALFSMLFGTSAILLLTRLEKSQPGLRAAEIYYTRLIWLLIFGLFNAYVLLWAGDILYHYALCGLFLFPLRNRSPKFLIWLAVFFIAVLTFKEWNTRQENRHTREKGLAAMAIEARKDSLTEEQKEDLSKWKSRLDNQKIENQRKETDKDVKAMQNKSYAKVWTHRQPVIREMESTLTYDDLFFDALIFILIGMALYRLGVLTGELSWLWYALFVVIGYSTTGVYAWYMGHWWQQANFDYLTFTDISPLSISVYQWRRLATSMAHLGVLVLLWKSGAFGWLIKALANVGQMAFTNYLMQSVICTFIFHGYGLGYYGTIQRYEQIYYLVGVWVFQLIFSAVWLQYFRFGPLEWLWRSLTYWTKQPMRKSTPVTAETLP